METPPHIGIVTTSFPRWYGDTAGSFVFGMARAFARRGARVDVVVPEPPEQPDWSPGSEWLAGVRVFAAPYVRPRRFQTLFFGAGAPENLSRHPCRAGLAGPAFAGMIGAVRTRSRHWDAVVSHWMLPSAIAAGVGTARRVRHLAIAHSGDVHWLGKLPGSRVLRSFTGRVADRLGFISHDLRRRFLSGLSPEARGRLAARSGITPMGIDLDELTSRKSRQTLRRELAFKGFTVLFLGRLAPIKGVDRLIESVAGMDVGLVVAGDGPERMRLERLATAHGVSARFFGAVGPELRADLFGACDVLVLPSRPLEDGRTEGLPLVVLEAQGAGLPVIASNTGAVSEVIDHGQTGLLVEPGDRETLKQALVLAMSEGNLMKRIKKTALCRVRERSWSTLIVGYERLLLA